MADLSLQRFDNDGIELVINTQTGESFATKRGYARMGNVDESTVRKRLKGADSSLVKMAKIQTPGGIQGADLISEDLIAKWLPKDNPSMATSMLKVGIRASFHCMAGFDITSTAVQPPALPEPIEFKIPQTYAEALLEAGRLALENEKLTTKIEQDAPLVAFAETVQASDDAIDFNSFAKAINTGRTRLFRLMRECGVIMQNTTLPYQRWCDAGYFEVSQEVTSDGKLRPFALVTGKGQIWLKQKIDAHNKQQQQFVNLITQGVLGF